MPSEGAPSRSAAKARASETTSMTRHHSTITGAAVLAMQAAFLVALHVIRH